MPMPEFASITWRKSSRSGQNGACVEVGTWRKSSRSGQGGQCVEVGARRKSDRSGQNGNWVEVAASLCVVLVRDSKDPSGPRLAVAPDQWVAFTRGLTAGTLS